MRGRRPGGMPAHFSIAAGAMVVLAACAGGPADGGTATPSTPAASTVNTTSTTGSTVRSEGASDALSTGPTTPSGLVRVTGDVMERARQYGLVAPTGEYVGPVDSDGNPLIFEPIGGYGDFSEVDLFEVDPTEIVSLQARCIQDHGFPVEVDSSGSGFGFERVPPEQNQLAFAVAIACKVGLNLPPPTTPTAAQRAEQLHYLGLVAECLRERGFDVDDPPSLDEFIEADGAWSPYDSLPQLTPTEFEQLDRSCPQWPVGGYGAWDPGDPLRSRP